MPHPTHRRRSRPHFPAASVFTLAAGILMTLFVFLWAWKDAAQNDQKRFLASVEQYRQEFETRAEKYEQGLEIIADWISFHEKPSQTQWDNRMERMNLRAHYPGLTELAFAPGFAEFSNNKERWQEAPPAHWPPVAEWRNGEFRVWYQAAQGPAARPPWGRDLAGLLLSFGDRTNFFHSKGVRSTRKLLVPAANSNRPLAAFTFVIGAFRGDLPRPTKLGETYAPGEDLGGYVSDRGKQRQMATIGLIAATICMEPFLESIFGSRPLEIDVDIYAGPIAEPNRMTRLHLPPLTRSGSAHYLDIELPWYVDRWHIVAVPNDLFYKNSHRIRAWVMGACGVLLTLSIYVTMRVQERARVAAEDLANDLERARQELRQAHKGRVRLERDLHDGVLQSIYASVLGLRRAARSIPADPAAALPIVREIGDELDAAMTDIRRHLSSQPSEGISPLQLPETVAGLANAYNRTGQSKVEYDLDESAILALDPEQSEQIFQCVREAVTNAHRHGRAQTIRIRIRKSAAGVEVLVHDDGAGFDPLAPAHHGRGLKHMRQRAELCGGSFDLTTQRGGPTTIQIQLPAGKIPNESF